MDCLPDELLTTIYLELEPYDLNISSIISRRMNKLTTNDEFIEKYALIHNLPRGNSICDLIMYSKCTLGSRVYFAIDNRNVEDVIRLLTDNISNDISDIFDVDLLLQVSVMKGCINIFKYISNINRC